MKRYHAFFYADYEANGGVEDYIDVFETTEEAKAACEVKIKEWGGTGHIAIVDEDTGKLRIIWEGYIHYTTKDLVWQRKEK